MLTAEKVNPTVVYRSFSATFEKLEGYHIHAFQRQDIQSMFYLCYVSNDPSKKHQLYCGHANCGPFVELEVSQLTETGVKDPHSFNAEEVELKVDFSDIFHRTNQLIFSGSNPRLSQIANTETGEQTPIRRV